MCRWGQILKWCSYKPRNCWSHQKLEGAKKDCSLEPLERAPWVQTSGLQDCERVFVVSHPVCADLLWQPQEADTVLFCIFQASMIVTWCTKYPTIPFFSLFDIYSGCYAHFNFIHFLCSVEFHCMSYYLAVWSWPDFSCVSIPSPRKWKKVVTIKSGVTKNQKSLPTSWGCFEK